MIFNLQSEAPTALWKCCVPALFFGALASLSLSPYNWWPVLFISFTGLVWLIDAAVAGRNTSAAKFRAGFAVGWCFALGYFVPSLWWISEAFWVEPEKFAALIPLAVFGLPSYLSIYWGLACGIAAMVWSTGWSRVLLLSILIGIFEWLRGHLLTGFPWNLPGYGVSSLDGFAQTASVVGIYGLTVIVIMIAATPAILKPVVGWSGRKSHQFVLIGVIATLAVIAHLWGQARLSAYDAVLTSAETEMRSVRIVQPNILQKDKWNPEKAQDIIDRYLSLTAQPMAQQGNEPPIIVWPESALPRLVGEEDVLRAEIAANLPDGSPLLLGGLHRITDEKGNRSIFNSLLSMTPQGQVEARHDKVRLVPFGEFLPFAWALEPLGLRQLVNLPPGFSSGKRLQTVQTSSGFSFVGFICYEAVFPQSVPYETRPDILINATNDAWFGTSGGPHQHLAQARFRSIEQGLPMIRAANTGISAIIDSTGRVTVSLGLGKQGIIDARLPTSLNKTLYASFGDLVFLMLLVLMSVVYLICRRIKNLQ